MKRFSFAVFLCGFLSHALPGELVYKDIPPLQRLEAVRLRGPRRLVGPGASILVETPGNVAILPPENGADTLQVPLRARHPGSGATVEAEVAVSLDSEGRSRGPFSRIVELDLSAFPDGEVIVELELPDPATRPPPLAFLIVREAFAAVAEKHRPEMEAWIQDANQLNTIWGKRPLWPNLDRALARPDHPHSGLRGFLLRAYWNPQLERMQPYTLYVPESLDLDEPAPLMVLLHGSGGDYRNLVADYAAGQRFEENPVLIVNAGAFRNLEFRHLALNNVRWILEDVASKYKVDPDRIYAQGISLGGRGVLDLAANLPDTFAAVSSQGTYGVHRTLLDPWHAMTVDRTAFGLAARNDIRTWLPNLGTTPVEMVFGWNDASTRPAGALAISTTLQTHGNQVVERGFDLGHNLTLPEYDWATTRAWFLRHRKERWPRRLHFRVANLRHNRFAWIQVEALHDYSGVGEVRARIGPERELLLETGNVARLRYFPPPLVHQAATVFPTEPRLYHFDEAGNPVEPPESADTPRWRKHPGQSGPLWNVFSDPFLLVVDSSLDPESVAALRQWAERNAMSDAAPGPFRFTVKEDRELTETERETRNLIFFTRRESEHPWRDLIPLELPAKAETLRKEKDHALLAVRPSPWSDHRLVMIAELNGGPAISIAHHWFFQEHLQPDWLMLSGREVLAAGAYTHNWTAGPMTTDNFVTRILTQ